MASAQGRSFFEPTRSVAERVRGGTNEVRGLKNNQLLFMRYGSQEGYGDESRRLPKANGTGVIALGWGEHPEKRVDTYKLYRNN